MTFPILSTVLNVSSIFLEKSRSNGGVTAPLDLAFFPTSFYPVCILLMFIHIRCTFYINHFVTSWKNMRFLCNGASQVFAPLLQISWNCNCLGQQITVISGWFQVFYIIVHRAWLFMQISIFSQAGGAFKYNVSVFYTILHPLPRLAFHYRLRPHPLNCWSNTWIEDEILLILVYTPSP